MRLFRLILIVTVCVAFAAACAGGAPAPGSASTPTSSSAAISQAPPSATPSPTPSPSGLVLHVLADFTSNSKLPLGGALKWEPNTLTAPADQAFQIAMKVTNETIHNLWVEDGKGKALFEGGDQAHGTKAYDIPALKAGTYYFVCTYHRQLMTGTLTVH